jgi:hypothetical protein
MCIAITARKGYQVPFAHLQEGFRSNPHGAGFAYANPETGTVVVEKGFFTFKDLWERFTLVNGTHDLMVHCRWSTEAGKNALNCHPWQVDNRHAMMHNGVLKEYTGFHNGLSDTGNFNEQIVKPMVAANPQLLKTPWFNALITQAIGSGNKVAILDADGDIQIFGEHLGNYAFNGGIWYSNFDYVKKKKRNKKKAKATLVTPA